MKKIISIAALSTALLSAPAFADESQTLSIKDFVGTVTITTGEDFSVSGEKGNITEIRQNGLIIDGNEIIDNSRCKTVNGKIELSFGRKSWFKRMGGYKDLDAYPKLDIIVPEGSHLEIRDSVIFGTGEDFGSVDAKVKSCGDLEIGNINGPLILGVSGSGDFSALNTRTANVKISGSGDVSLGDIETSVIKVSGSGDFDAENIEGDAKVTSTGSGSIEIDSLLGDLVYEGRGSSNFDAQRVDGRISITATGSGDVEIEDGDAPTLMITSRGSSNIEFGGTAGDVTVVASGSGNVEIDNATGEREVKSSGSSYVKIADTRYDD